MNTKILRQGILILMGAGITLLLSQVFVHAAEETKLKPLSRATAPHVYYKKGLGQALERKDSLPGERIEVILNAYQTEGRFTIMDFTFPVGSDSSPGHFHATHSETYMLISGKMEWIVEGEKRILEAGDVVYVPPNTYHSARTLGNEGARTIFIFEPGGFVQDVGARNALTAEQKKDPKYMLEFFKTIDYHFDIARAHDHDKK